MIRPNCVAGEEINCMTERSRSAQPCPGFDRDDLSTFSFCACPFEQGLPAFFDAGFFLFEFMTDMTDYRVRVV